MVRLAWFKLPVKGSLDSVVTSSHSLLLLAMSDAAHDGAAPHAGDANSPGEEVRSPSKVKSPSKSTSMKRPAASGALMKRPVASKVVAKAKPKTKPVPKPKTVMKSNMKRPASNQGNQTMQQKGGKVATSNWATGLVTEKKEEEKTKKTEESKDQEEGAKEEAKTQDECVEPNKVDMEEQGAKLNRSKSNKFVKMLDCGQLPQWLADEYRRLMALKVGKRDKIRDLINQALDHKGGKLILSTDKPYFHSIQRTYGETKSKEVEKSLPKRLLMGKFNLFIEDFDAALAEGDLVQVTTRKGKVQYMWDSSAHVNVEGKKHESGLSMEKQISKKQKGMMEVAQQAWSIGLFVPTGDSSGSGGAQQGHKLAIKDRQKPLTADQWSQAEAQLKPAMDAFETMSQKALKFLSNISHNKEDPLYGQLSSCALVARKYLGMYLWYFC